MRKFSKMKCINCGQLGHTRKVCKEPKTSFGILAIHIDNVNNLMDESLVDDKKDKAKTRHTRVMKNIIDYLQNQSYIIDNPVIINNECDFLNKFTEVKKIVKVLLIMRRHTLGYMEFMRGHYNINNMHQLKNLFQQMTPEEIQIISEHKNNFDYLWRYLWSINENNSKTAPKTEHEKIDHEKIDHEKTLSPQETHSFHSNSTEGSKRNNSFFENYEYEKSKINFEKLCNETSISLQDIIKLTKSQYDFPEWGIPKGRRAGTESDIDCAKREFTEETGYTSDDYILFDNIQPLVENITGFDGRKYRHIYYIALLKSNRIPTCNELKKLQLCEIGDIGLFDLDQSLMAIRTHHIDRRYIMYKLCSGVIKNIIENYY